MLGISMLVFLANALWSLILGDRATRTRGSSKSLEWQLPTPVPVHNFDASRW